MSVDRKIVDDGESIWITFRVSRFGIEQCLKDQELLTGLEDAVLGSVIQDLRSEIERVRRHVEDVDRLVAVNRRLARNFGSSGVKN